MGNALLGEVSIRQSDCIPVYSWCIVGLKFPSFLYIFILSLPVWFHYISVAEVGVISMGLGCAYVIIQSIGDVGFFHVKLLAGQA